MGLWMHRWIMSQGNAGALWLLGFVVLLILIGNIFRPIKISNWRGIGIGLAVFMIAGYFTDQIIVESLIYFAFLALMYLGHRKVETTKREVGSAYENTDSKRSYHPLDTLLEYRNQLRQYGVSRGYMKGGRWKKTA